MSRNDCRRACTQCTRGERVHERFILICPNFGGGHFFPSFFREDVLKSQKDCHPAAVPVYQLSVAQFMFQKCWTCALELFREMPVCLWECVCTCARPHPCRLRLYLCTRPLFCLQQPLAERTNVSHCCRPVPWTSGQNPACLPGCSGLIWPGISWPPHGTKQSANL